MLFYELERLDRQAKMSQPVDSLALKFVTETLQNTDVEQLPYVLPSLVAVLHDCGHVFSLPEGIPKDSHNALILSKFKTQVSAFLKSRKHHTQHAGIVLVKTIIDIGDTSLKECTAWVRELLSILASRSTPLFMKGMCVVALTKIFLLTQGRPTFIRGITTPNLPPFITSCMKIISSCFHNEQQECIGEIADILCSIFESFHKLIPSHPTMFRTYTGELRDVLCQVLTPTTSLTISHEVSEAASRLLSVIPFSATKDAAGEEWSGLFTGVISDLHETADQVFRGITEDWQSAAGYQTSVSSHTPASYAHDPEQNDHASLHLHLRFWKGIDTGCQRLQDLLHILRTILQTQSPSEAAVPLGRLVDVLTRLASTTTPVASAPHTNQAHNDQISRTEREALWAHLPSIHTQVLAVIEIMSARLGKTSLGVCESLIENVTWLCSREGYSAAVRGCSYNALSTILEICGSALSARQAAGIERIIEQCCKDVVPQQAADPDPAATVAKDTIISSESTMHTPSLQASASDLLNVYLSSIPSSHISSGLRTLVDRTIILSNDGLAMRSSVQNLSFSALQPAQSSVLPLLARAFPERSMAGEMLPQKVPEASMEQHPAVESDDDADAMDTKFPARAEDTAAQSEAGMELKENTEVRPLDTGSAVEENGQEETILIANVTEAPQSNVEPAEASPAFSARPSAKRSPSPDVTARKRARLAEDAGDEDEDDEDFVIPPLTLKGESEDEEEEEA